jgi:hypothetical protein
MNSRLKVLITGMFVVFMLPLQGMMESEPVAPKPSSPEASKPSSKVGHPLTWFKNNAWKLDPFVYLISPQLRTTILDARDLENTGIFDLYSKFTLKIKNKAELNNTRIIIDETLFDNEEELEAYKADAQPYIDHDFSDTDVYKRSEKTKLQSAYGVSAAAVATVVLGSVLYKYHTVIRDKAQKLYKKLS